MRKLTPHLVLLFFSRKQTMYPADPKKVFVRPVMFQEKRAALLTVSKANLRIPLDQIRAVADALHDIADSEESQELHAS